MFARDLCSRLCEEATNFNHSENRNFNCVSQIAKLQGISLSVAKSGKLSVEKMKIYITFIAVGYEMEVQK